MLRKTEGAGGILDAAGIARPAVLGATGTRLVIFCMVLGLAIFYRASTELPLTLVGALIFIPAALVRPDLAVPAVVATVPLYLAPKVVLDKRFGLSRPEGYLLPLHEFILLVSAAGSVRYAVRLRVNRERLRHWLRSDWPLLLFLLTGTLGVVVAGKAGRATALREWRWLIVEPLIFYALVRLYGGSPAFRRGLLWTWLGTGAVVAALALLQVTGLNLPGLIRTQACSSDPLISTGGVERATSVYCHPNNLGLALGRVWPVLAALALGVGMMPGVSGRLQHTAQRLRQSLRVPSLVPALLMVVVLAGLVVSFSKGAWLGAFVALVVLGLTLRRRVLLGIAGLAAVTVVVLGVALGIERLNPLGGSTGARFEIWGSALAMLRDHPWFGIGLDQFYRLRNHDVAGPYISAAAVGTSERYAAHPHNLVLDILLRVGPLGLVAFGALLVRFFRRATGVLDRGRREEYVIAAGLLAAMVAALVHGLVDNFYFVADLAIVFWLQVAIIDLLFAKRLDSASTGDPALDRDELR